MRMILCFLFGVSFLSIPSKAEVYELRTYQVGPHKMESLLTRFRDHSLALLSKHGMSHIGYWLPVDDSAEAGRLVYILSHDSPAAGRASWGAFSKDPAWQKARDESERDGKLVTAFSSVYLDVIEIDHGLLNTLQAAAVSPALYELRTIRCAKGTQSAWADALLSGGLENWRKHGLKPAAVWRSIPSPKNEVETISALLVHGEALTVAEKWRAVAADSQWLELLKQVGGVESSGPVNVGEGLLMRAVDFSPLK